MPKVKVARPHYGDDGWVHRGAEIEVTENRRRQLGPILVGGQPRDIDPNRGGSAAASADITTAPAGERRRPISTGKAGDKAER